MFKRLKRKRCPTLIQLCVDLICPLCQSVALGTFASGTSHMLSGQEVLVVYPSGMGTRQSTL